MTAEYGQGKSGKINGTVAHYIEQVSTGRCLITDCYAHLRRLNELKQLNGGILPPEMQAERDVTLAERKSLLKRHRELRHALKGTVIYQKRQAVMQKIV